MDIEDINGTWKGFFTYGPDYPPEYQPIKEEFTLKLSVDNGIIFGSCVDTFTDKYFDEPATVEGTLVDGVLSLIKKYPYFLGTDENEVVFVDRTRPSHDVHYLGRLKRKLFSESYFVEGTWNISGSYLNENGEALYYEQDGDFEMHMIQ